MLVLVMVGTLQQQPTVPSCPLKANLGIPCLTCGATRVALALHNLDLITAFATNPLVTVYAVVLVCGGLIAGGLAWANRPLPQLVLPGATRWILLSGILLNWIYLIWVET